MKTNQNQPQIHRFASLSAFPGVVHGLSTRQGGVSKGPFASLNLGWTVGDDPAHVEVNYQRLASAAGVERRHLTTTWQVHGNRVVRARAVDRGEMIAKADGIVTGEPNLPLSQRYADCTPLLIYDPRQHAAGLAHAGWRGTLANVAAALVQTMTAEFGSQPDDLVAAIGPSIGPCCYAVGPEVAEAVQAAFPSCDGLLSSSPSGPSHPPALRSFDDAVPLRAFFNLWQANWRQLGEAGVSQIEVAGICTRCHRETYFSHRGDHGHTGRFAAVMMLRG